MSVVAPPAATTAPSPISRPPPHHVAPSHSILRPCNAKGIPIGPPVIAPAGLSIQVPRAVSGPASAATSASATPTRAPVFVTPAPSSPTASQRTVSSTDSLSTPSLSTAASISPSTSAISTAASADWANNDVFETESTASSTGASTPRSSMIDPSPKIRFGHLPERPPELRRRNSITLGVLARKNMLHAQGTIPAGGGSSGGFNKVYMTDAEWEAYQQKFQKPANANTVDLGAVMSSGAKKFWTKVRRGSNASVTSNASTSSVAAPPRGRSDSAPTSAQPVSPRVAPVVDVAPVIEEEEEPHSAPGSPRRGALHLTSMDGDATPGRRRSPSPQNLGESAIYDDEDDEFSNASRSPVSTTSQVSVSPDPQQEQQQQHQNQHQHSQDAHHRGGDDADAEWDSHHTSSTAALGFEIRDYSKRPTWGRRGSGSGPAPVVEAAPQTHPRLN